MHAFRVKLGTNKLNCVDVPLNPTHSLTHSIWINSLETVTIGLLAPSEGGLIEPLLAMGL